VKLQVGILEGERVKLVPLAREYTENLYRAVDSGEIWTYLPSRMETFEDMIEHVEEALESWESGIEVPFVVIDKESNEIVGMTRFEDVSLENRKLEIGWTWYSKKVWGTRVNTEAKFLLLRYCFDVLNLVRVQFTVDTRNLRSRKAVLRIGAKEEGILRMCGILYNGYIRDMVYYSIINNEWSTVKTRITNLLATQQA
jgi:N-acetyltransferase